MNECITFSGDVAVEKVDEILGHHKIIRQPDGIWHVIGSKKTKDIKAEIKKDSANQCRPKDNAHIIIYITKKWERGPKGEEFRVISRRESLKNVYRYGQHTPDALTCVNFGRSVGVFVSSTDLADTLIKMDDDLPEDDSLVLFAINLWTIRYEAIKKENKEISDMF